MLALSLELARHHAVERLMPLGRSGAVVVGLAALIVVLLEAFWSLAQHVQVMAHEGAHALVGRSLGHKVTSVTLNREGTGETVMKPPSGRPSVLTGVAGYLGSSAFGVGAAKLIELGYIGAVLWVALILLAVLLVSVRNVFGIISVVISGVLLFLILRNGSAGTQTAAAYGLAWFLLLSGVRTVLEHRTGAADAAALRSLTHVPKTLWFGIWLAGSAAALWYGGSLLV